MAESETEIKVCWKVTDLLDLDYFLHLDSELSEADLSARDEQVAEQQLRPVLGGAAMVTDAAAEIRSCGIFLWLRQRRDEEVKKNKRDSSILPSELYAQVSRLVKWLGGMLMLSLGAALIFSLLHREEQYFNVLMFLAATLLPQIFLLILLLLGWLFRRFTGQVAATGGVAQALLRAAMFWVSGRVRKYHAGEQLHGQWQMLKGKTYLMAPVLAMSQTMAVFYNLGILAGFALCLLSMDVRFFWESTPGIAAVEGLEKIVEIISMPWATLLADGLPAYEGIRMTRITIEGAEKIFPASKVINSASVWVPFLAASVVFWGLLPRLILRAGIGVWNKRSLSSYAFIERRHRELWRRLTALKVEISNQGPDDDAVLLLWGGLTPDSGELRKVLLQQLRLNPLQTFAAGNETDSSLDAERLQQVAAQMGGMKEGVRLVVVVESWALAPREAADFLDELRHQVGDQRAVRLLLMGPPASGRAFTEPSAAEIKTWEDLAARRNDVNLTVYPYRKSDG